MSLCPISGRACEGNASTPVGAIAKPCPKSKGALWIHVLDDAGNNVREVDALKDGGSDKPTDTNGLSTYDPLDEGNYIAGLAKLSVKLAKLYMPPETTSQKVFVADGQITYVGFELKREARLKVLVHKVGDTGKVFGKAPVKLTEGPETPDGQTVDDKGIHDFTPDEAARLTLGKYKLKAELSGTDAENYQIVHDYAAELKSIEINANDDVTFPVEVEPKNLATPKIEVEYKVVLLERKLSQHQDNSEQDKIYAMPTRVDLSFTEMDASQPDQPYGGSHHYDKGGVFTCAGNVEIFLDAECKTPLGSDGKLTKDQLAADKKFSVYLRGKDSAGKFTAKLQLNDPSDRFIKLGKNPAEVPMGVVELKMTLHQHDKTEIDKLAVHPDVDPIATYFAELKNLALPDQKAMDDGPKVKPGRFLHVQASGSVNNGRAKLVVAKYTDDHWPDGTDGYEVIIQATNASGGVAIHGKEWDNDQKSPAKLTVAELKAEEHVFWVQGQAVTDTTMAVRLDIGLQRASVTGDPHTSDFEIKRNGDWARFTVVRIDEVKLEVTTPGTKPVVMASGKFYINTDADPAGRTLKTKSGDREIKVTAKLSKELKGVTIHFMLVAEKTNRDNTNVPAGWEFEKLKKVLKHTDKPDREKLLHFSATTDDKGVATVDTLILSCIGGDKFKIGAYIDQDPHLAKYIDEAPSPNADISARKPTLASDWIQVWRRIQYQYDAMARDGGGDYSNRKDEGGFTGQYAAAFIEMESVGNGTPAHRRVLGDDQVQTWAAGQSSIALGTARYTYMALIDSVGGGGPQQETVIVGPSLGGGTVNFLLNGYTIDNSDQARWLASAQICEYDGSNWGPYAPVAGNLLQMTTQGNDFNLAVDLSSKDPAKWYQVDVTIIKYTSISGLSSGNVSLVDMRYKERFFSAQATSMALNTLLHEVGHYLGLGAKKIANEANGTNPLWYDTPGVGNHCKYNNKVPGTDQTGDCVMWHSGSSITTFCPTCNKALRARKLYDLSGGGGWFSSADF
jgi:hypothetical protein